MKFFLIILTAFLFQSCNKPKSVLICGDHNCINKKEAEQYFEENLTIEVKIIDMKKKREINLVELNLNNNNDEEKKINIIKINKTNKQVKTLSNDEIKKIKKEIIIKETNKKITNRAQIKNKKNKKIAKKTINKNKNSIKKKLVKNERNDDKLLNNEKINKSEKNDSKRNKEVVDICTILEKCSIDTISKYLLEEGKLRGFPDITVRE